MKDLRPKLPTASQPPGAASPAAAPPTPVTSARFDLDLTGIRTLSDPDMRPPAALQFASRSAPEPAHVGTITGFFSQKSSDIHVLIRVGGTVRLPQ